MAQQRSFIPVFNDSSTNLQYLKQLRRWLLEGLDFRAVSFRSDCRWTAKSLVMAGILWVWSAPVTLVSRFQLANQISQRLYPKLQLADLSYQSFIKLLRRHTPHILPLLVASLRQRMQQDLAEHFFINGRAVFAVDGTKIRLPKTVSNEEAYAKTKQRKEPRPDAGAKTQAGHLRNKVPQFYLTILFNLGTQLMWDWRAGPSNASETEHLQEMLGSLPQRSLVVADAGFIGFDLWNAVFDAGHDWVVRVGANVRLLRKLGFCRENQSTVYYWPEGKRQKGFPPLVFRILRIDGGKYPVYLLTNLKHAELTDRQLAELYRRRWGIEVYNRSLKCVYGRSKLRSGNAENALIELQWSLIGLWAAQAMALCQTGIQPPKLSCARVINALQTTITHYRVRPEKHEDLASNLAKAVIDSYSRKSKAQRNPTKLNKNYSTKGEPKILEANQLQIKSAKKIKLKIRLTA